jgi:polysaccharide chain length determinant protein (PEP-CTERM system associated)
MIPGKRYTPQDVLQIALRRKWLIAVPLVVAALGVAAAIKVLPKKYRSETLILVVPQRVPESYVRSTVTARVEDRLQTIREQIMSRTRLERIITDFDLYAQRRSVAVMEDVVTFLRSQIFVDMVRGDAFRVAYVAEDPLVAQKVTERLASLIIEENLRDREVLAEATNQFLDTQLTEARARLVEHEKRLEAYRREHGGELPTQVQSNMQALQTLQVQIQGLADSVSRDRDRLFTIDNSLSELPERMASGILLPGETRTEPAKDADGIAVGPASVQLASAREMLRSLETRLKPEHPDIVRLNRIVRELESKADVERKAEADARANKTVPVTPPSAFSTRTAQLREERATLLRQIEVKDGQLANLRAQIGTYQARLDAAPTRESEMTELMRDYDTLRGVYTDLLGKRESSKVAANLERRQIGEQFKILDPANRPERPFSPNRRFIALGGIVGGLAIGIGLIVLLEFRDQTFRTDRDIVQALGLPVLAMIPRMPNAAERRVHRRRMMLAASGAVVTLAVIAVVALTWLR